MQAYPFVVDETPYCLWDWNIPERNLEFLDAIDPDYFSNTVQLLIGGLESDEKHHAGIAIRLTYSQALETFFAFLGATVQAPRAPIGWLLKYQVVELRSVVKKLSTGKHLLTRLHGPLTWEALSAAIHRFQLEDQAKEKSIKAGFASAWQRFAGDFLNDKSTAEYNGIKHGLRLRSGGVTIAAGRQDMPGVPAPPDRMKVIAAEEFGSTYFAAETLGATKVNFRALTAFRAWDPLSLANRIQLLSFSIANVVGYLKILSGRPPAEVKYFWPSQPDEAFEEAWDARSSHLEFAANVNITAAEIKPMSKTEVLESYKSASNSE